jgi:TRAP-type C4-dicarboxylate transport system permease small subunit
MNLQYLYKAVILAVIFGFLLFAINMPQGQGIRDYLRGFLGQFFPFFFLFLFLFYIEHFDSELKELKEMIRRLTEKKE